MESYLLDWVNLLLRWAHLITGIAWIGASFYFVWLDDSLLPPRDPKDTERGIGGEVWSVHGGGFYQAQKFKVAPDFLPKPLHWFKWEAYWTGITGILLLALIYWHGAEIYLIDPSVAELSPWAAVGIGVATLVGGWVVYDLLCRSPLGKNDKLLGIVLFVLVCLSAFLLTQVFSGRGAYYHFGAMLGTIMVANVFFVIMPGQRELVAACEAQRVPDAGPGLRAKQRSVHNTYFTLPVLFVMISNHYAGTYGSEYNWLVLIALSLSGALIRIWFVQRHKGNGSPWVLGTALVLLLAVVVAQAPSAPAKEGAGEGVSFAEVQSIVQMRCASCHASEPTQPGFAVAPKGVVFDTPEDILTQAATIHQQTVVSRAMPIGNLTQMTEEERAKLGQWYESGAEPD